MKVWLWQQGPDVLLAIGLIAGVAIATAIDVVASLVPTRSARHG